MDIRPQVSASHEHVLFLDNEGYVWQFGYSSLVCSESSGKYVKKVLNLPHPITMVEASRYRSLYSMFIDENGVVWAAGQFENFKWDGIQQIMMKTAIATISCGSDHCMFTDTDNKIWALGNNEYNKLGIGSNYASTSIPTHVDIGPPIKKIECGCMHTIMLDEEGFVWVMGGSTLGQLGLKEARASTNPRKLDAQNLPKIKDISSYFLHTILLDIDGNVWGAGHNSYGELGLGAVDQLREFQIIFQIHRVAQIATGYHTVLCTVDGGVWTTGYNSHGQLGIGNIMEGRSFSLVNHIPKIHRAYCGMYSTLLEDEAGFFWRAGAYFDGRDMQVTTKFKKLKTNFHLNRPQDRLSAIKSARKK